ncbi:MAG: hypothetical protein QOG77_1202, partial [Solirubrobacteraceae bacterium]|nr:hypothetical protein [Solirubrobacteraceae bacterium]
MHVSRIVVAVVGAVLVLVTAITAVLGFSYDARQQEVAHTDVRRAALRSLNAELDGLVATTHQVAGLFSASEGVTASEFRTFTQPLLRDGSASAFGWVPHVTDAERATWERTHRIQISQLDADRKVIPAPRRASYEPTEMLETAFDVQVPPGLDAAAQPTRLQALRSAARRSEPQATPVTTLVGSNAPGILVYAAVRHPDGTPRGSAVGTFRVAQLTQAMSGVLPKGAAFALRQGGRTVGSHGRLAAGADSWTVEVAGQRWQLVTSPAASGRLGNGVIALVVGGLLTALVLLTVSKLARDAGRAERKASQSEERFAHAFDAAPVGMALLDASTRHTKVNEALARMLGHTRESLTGLAAMDVMPPEEAS